MNFSDLPEEITVEFDVQRLGWWCFIPLAFLSRVGAKNFLANEKYALQIAEKIAHLIAQPGPMQREARKQITKNNKRRFGR